MEHGMPDRVLYVVNHGQSQHFEQVFEAARRWLPAAKHVSLVHVAGAYSSFYDAIPVLEAEGAERTARLALCDLTGLVLRRGLELLGIRAPDSSQGAPDSSQGAPDSSLLNPDSSLFRFFAWVLAGKAYFRGMPRGLSFHSNRAMKNHSFAVRSLARPMPMLILKAVSLLALFVALPPFATAADLVWIGNDGFDNSNFDRSGNWQGNTLPTWGYGNSLKFNQNVRPGVTGLIYDYNFFQNVNDIFWDTSFPVARTLTASNGGGINFKVRLENQSSFTQTVTMPLSGGKDGAADIQLNPVNGSLILSGTIFNDDSKSYAVFGSQTATVTNLELNTALGPNAPTQASVNFAVAGGRNTAVQVNASQVWAGTTDVQSGSFTTANGVTLASTAIIVGGGTVATTSANTLADTASLTVNTGRLSIGGSDTVASLAGSGGTIDIASGATLTFGNANSTSYAGSIGGSGNLSKVGSGTFTLSAASSMTGTTTVSAGQFSLGGSNLLANTSAVAVAGGVLALGGNSDTVGTFAISGGSLTGSGTVTAANYTLGGGTVSANLGSGAMNVTGNASLNGTWAGGTLGLTSGTLTLGSAGALGSSGTISFNGGTLQYSASNTTDYSGRFSTASSQQYRIDTNGQSVTLSSDLTSVGGTLTKLGSGTLMLTGTNSYDGVTTVSGGRLVATTSQSLPTNVMNNAELEFVTNGGNYSFSGTISGTGSLIKSGSEQLNLDGANTYSGGTIVAAGTLVGSADSLQGPIVNSGIVAFGVDGDGTYAGVISGSGSLEVRGGNLIVTGTSVYSGATTVMGGGRLSVNGALGNTAVVVQGGGELGGSGAVGGSVLVDGEGILSPGNSIASLAVGATTFTGTSEFLGASTFEYEVDSTNLGALGTAADLLVVNGDLNLSLDDTTILTVIDLAGSPNPFVQDTTSFALINYSGTWNNGLFTYDGTVLADGSRFLVGTQEWEIDYNRTSPTGLDNFTGDYLPSSKFVAITAVPEPTTCTLLAASGGMLIASMIRNRSRKNA
jgi:autotransporter-associated beta strand protein